jgi:hypothetical protein
VGTERRERQKANRQIRQEELAKQERKRTMTRRAVLIGVGVAVVLLIAVLLSIIAGGDDGDDDDPPASTAPAAAVDSTAEAAGDTSEPGTTEVSETTAPTPTT